MKATAVGLLAAVVLTLALTGCDRAASFCDWMRGFEMSVDVNTTTMTEQEFEEELDRYERKLIGLRDHAPAAIAEDVRLLVDLELEMVDAFRRGAIFAAAAIPLRMFTDEKLHAAVLNVQRYAREECGFRFDLPDPADPADPIDPIDPIDPVEPVDPMDPADPVDPREGFEPSEPSEPSEAPAFP